MISPVRILATLSTAFVVSAAWPARAVPQEPTLEQVVARMAQYVAAYGARTSFIVAVEHYTQQVTTEEGRVLRPRMLVSDFAIVRVGGQIGWTGFRDVVEVNGESVADRQDRLLGLLTGPAEGEGELRRIANESARFNVGPVARNFNVPTTVLFFFHPDRVSRFTFRKRGAKTIDGAGVWELDFRETARPTLVARRDGTDVPCEGSVWVVPEDGTVVRTRMRMRRFADVLTMSEGDPARNARAGGMGASPQDYGQVAQVQAPVQQPAPPSAPPQQAPSQPAPPSPASGSTPAPTGAVSGQVVTGGGNAAPVHQRPPREFGEAFFPEMREIESSAEIDVTYRRDPDTNMWLPAKMSEVYDGAIPRGTSAPLVGRAVGLAKYSGFRRFETSVKILAPR